MQFTKRKFLSLSLEKQHKKCAELLRDIYEKDEESLLENYHALQKWMGEKPLEDHNLKEISNRYHFHLRMAKQSLKEHNLLPKIRKKDRTLPKSKLQPFFLYLEF